MKLKFERVEREEQSLFGKFTKYFYRATSYGFTYFYQIGYGTNEDEKRDYSCVAGIITPDGKRMNFDSVGQNKWLRDKELTQLWFQSHSDAIEAAIIKSANSKLS